MIHEYLFLTDENKADVEAYKPDGISVEISSIENTPLWVVTYSLPNKNEDSAKRLSGVHSFIMQYSPLVLSCESSDYYNRSLFPLLNELERKLRKLLYLAASISDNEKAKDSITQLEEKDFGEIFDLLFIDSNFILDMKKRINADSKSEFNGKSRYSKAEIRSYLDSLAEHTLWDAILGDKDVPTLRGRFRDVQKFRNAVMHAHNISKELFGKARYLFYKVNRELDAAIGKLMGATGDETTETRTDVNTAISSALAAMDLSAVSETLKSASVLSGATELSVQLSRVLRNLQPLQASSAMTDSLKGIQGITLQPAITEALKGFRPIAINPAIAETLGAFQPLKQSTALTEALRNVNAFPATPAMENLKRQLSDMSHLMKPYSQMEELLRPYNAFQDSIRLLTDAIPHIASLSDGVGENEEPKEEPQSDNEGNEEERPNE